jgi:uncharacterized protein RhaS with RHS repeats
MTIANGTSWKTQNCAEMWRPLGHGSPTTRYQVTASNGTITRFLYDGDALVGEYDAAGEMTHRYVHWEGADVPIMSYAGTSLTSPTYLHPDHQGSIVAVSSASGASQINRYDEYGIPAAGNAAGSSIPGKSGSPSSASITTRPGSTRRRSGGSCRSTPWAMRTSSISMPMWGTIRST